MHNGFIMDSYGLIMDCHVDSYGSLMDSFSIHFICIIFSFVFAPGGQYVALNGKILYSMDKILYSLDKMLHSMDVAL